MKVSYLLSIKTTKNKKIFKNQSEIHLIRRQKEHVSKNLIHLAVIVRSKVIHHTSVEEDLTPNAPIAINLDMKL